MKGVRLLRRPFKTFQAGKLEFFICRLKNSFAPRIFDFCLLVLSVSGDGYFRVSKYTFDLSLSMASGWYCRHASASFFLKRRTLFSTSIW